MKRGVSKTPLLKKLLNYLKNYFLFFILKLTESKHQYPRFNSSVFHSFFLTIDLKQKYSLCFNPKR